MIFRYSSDRARGLSKRLPVSRPGDEIGRLTTTINDLLARLEAAFATQEEETLARQRRLAADASHVEVSDKRAGIPAEDLPRVFERFYRADLASSEGGAGLGLSIAWQIARAHGGEVEAESKPGKGSTFVPRIPKREPMP